MKEFLIVLTISFAPFLLFAQQERIDSLISLTENSIDSLRLSGNRELAIEYMRKSTEKAVEFAGKALTIARKLNNKREEAIALNLVGLGYSYLGDFSITLDYYNQSLRIREELKDNTMVSASLNNIGTIYIKQGDYDNALVYYLRALKIRKETNDETGLSQTLNNLGIYYLRLGNTEKSLEYYLQALEIKYRLGDAELIGSSLTNIGNLYSKMDNFSKAQEYFEKALEFRKKSGDIFGTALTYFNLANLLNKTGHTEKALEYIQFALISAVPGFSDNSVLANPETEMIYPEQQTLEILDFKAYLLYQLYLSNPGDRIHLERSLSTYEQVFEILQNIKADYSYEKDKIAMLRFMRMAFKQAVDVALLLYKLSDDPSYSKKAFQISEKYKANILFELIRSDEAKKFAGIPDSLIEKERQLMKGLSNRQYKINHAKLVTGFSSDSLASWESKIFEARMEINNLKDIFNADFPEYFDLLYTDESITITQIQKLLAEDEVILEYFESEESMNIFFVSQNNFCVFSEPSDSMFTNNISELRDLLYHNKFQNKQDSLKYVYINLAYPIYRYLLKPVEERLSGKKIIFIPDGIMSSVNFEMLVTDSINEKNTAFHQLPFFIKNGAVSYSYSASLYFKSLDKSKENDSGKGLAAFALSFENNNDLGNYGENHSQELTGTIDEVLEIIKITGGEAFYNEQATEEAFKLYAPNSRIIHAATHGNIDDENPMYSLLKFYPDSSGTEDGLLHTYELFGMSLEARIAVLSACNSGYGRLESGEGMMTLARGFLYAGVPTLIISLWDVNDESTSRIMKEFYQNLEKGLSSAEALHQAKLQYLENSDNILSNPYFWAGFIHIGPGQYISDQRNYLLWWLSLPVLGLIISYFIIKRKRNN